MLTSADTSCVLASNDARSFIIQRHCTSVYYDEVFTRNTVSLILSMSYDIHSHIAWHWTDDQYMARGNVNDLETIRLPNRR